VRRSKFSGWEENSASSFGLKTSNSSDFYTFSDHYQPGKSTALCFFPRLTVVFPNKPCFGNPFVHLAHAKISKHETPIVQTRTTVNLGLVGENNIKSIHLYRCANGFGCGAGVILRQEKWYFVRGIKCPAIRKKSS